MFAQEACSCLWELVSSLHVPPLPRLPPEVHVSAGRQLAQLGVHQHQDTLGESQGSAGHLARSRGTNKHLESDPNQNGFQRFPPLFWGGNLPLL